MAAAKDVLDNGAAFLESTGEFAFSQFVKDKFKKMVTTDDTAYCSQCKTEEQMYCVECNKTFCKPCVIRAHHPGTNCDAHSLEEIWEPEEQGIKVITPLLEEILLVSVLSFVFFHPLIKEDYLYSGNVCILTNYARRGVAYFDDKAFYVAKSSLAIYCNVEDSYWRLFTDLWVRDIVTDSDSVFLLLTSFISAMMFQQTVAVVLVPMLAALYAIAFGLISKLESFLPSQLTGLKQLQQIVKKLNFLDFCIGDDDDIPPLTSRRTRPSKSFYDFLWYEQNRIFREFSHFYCSTANVLSKILLWPICLVAVLRAVVHLLGLRGLLYNFMTVLFAEKVEKHTAWFKAASNDEYTDRLIDIALAQVWQTVAGVLPGLEGGMQASAPLLMYASQFLFLPIVVFAFLYVLRIYQEWKFDKTWADHGERERVRGPCKLGVQCLCECVQHYCKS